MNKIQALPGAFPLHENRNFLSESEWVIFKLLCRPVESFSEANAEELSAATGHQVTPERCAELISIVRIQQLPGLGSWISRLFAEAGFSENEIRNLPASQITERLNRENWATSCVMMLQPVHLQHCSCSGKAQGSNNTLEILPLPNHILAENT
jgi:hypothetical protein